VKLVGQKMTELCRDLKHLDIDWLNLLPTPEESENFERLYTHRKEGMKSPPKNLSDEYLR
jgi:hypothetical protein